MLLLCMVVMSMGIIHIHCQTFCVCMGMAIYLFVCAQTDDASYDHHAHPYGCAFIWVDVAPQITCICATLMSTQIQTHPLLYIQQHTSP